MSQQPEGDVSKKDSSSATPPPQDNLSVTHHKINLGGREIRYTATTGTLVLSEESEKEGEEAGAWEGEKPKAEIFIVAYTRDDVQDHARRPLTFSFNGGPGSSSVWMHLGLLGPKRVVMDEQGQPTPPPYTLTTNEHSLLEHSDLVFIDPVSTGYSRAVRGEKAKAFHDFKKDIESVGNLIRLYVTRNRRWHSPKFLIGESYGTTRAAGLATYLQEQHGMYLSGIMFVSSVLDFQTLRATPGNDLPHSLYLPSFTATAHYHKKLPEALQQKPLREVLDEVEAFVMERYTLALMRGSALPKEERREIVSQLAHYTGLEEAYIEHCDLRIDIMRFVKELLRDEKRTVGRLDSRYKGIDRDAAGETFEYDPSHAAIQGTYTATLNHYVRTELEFKSDRTYEILKSLYRDWRYRDFENQYVSVSDGLRKAMSMNPHLRVHVANGYYDLATPYFASEYTFNHLSLDESLRGNVSMSYYPAGHMMYVQLESLAKLKQALSSFIGEALP